MHHWGATLHTAVCIIRMTAINAPGQPKPKANLIRNACFLTTKPHIVRLLTPMQANHPIGHVQYVFRACDMEQYVGVPTDRQPLFAACRNGVLRAAYGC